MFDFSEILLLAVIALIFIGPKQLPEVAKVIARLFNELKRATGDLHSSMIDLSDKTDILNEAKNSIAKTLLEGGKDLRTALKPEEKKEDKPEPNKPS